MRRNLGQNLPPTDSRRLPWFNNSPGDVEALAVSGKTHMPLKSLLSFDQTRCSILRKNVNSLILKRERLQSFQAPTPR